MAAKDKRLPVFSSTELSQPHLKQPVLDTKNGDFEMI
jgi:hypothetical protein